MVICGFFTWALHDNSNLTTIYCGCKWGLCWYIIAILILWWIKIACANLEYLLVVQYPFEHTAFHIHACISWHSIGIEPVSSILHKAQHLWIKDSIPSFLVLFAICCCNSTSGSGSYTYNCAYLILLLLLGSRESHWWNNYPWILKTSGPSPMTEWSSLTPREANENEALYCLVCLRKSREHQSSPENRSWAYWVELQRAKDWSFPTDNMCQTLE